MFWTASYFYSGTKGIQQQCSSEAEEGRNTTDGSSDGEDGDVNEEESDKEKLKDGKTGNKRLKKASTKVRQLLKAWSFLIIYKYLCSFTTTCREKWLVHMSQQLWVFILVFLFSEIWNVIYYSIALLYINLLYLLLNLKWEPKFPERE